MRKRIMAIALIITALYSGWVIIDGCKKLIYLITG